jgi:hypothetical protein
MAHADVYDHEKRDVIIRQLRPVAQSLLERSASGGVATSGIGESFQIWIVSLANFRESGATHARWTRAWHHQIRPADGAATLYAHSREPELAPAEAIAIFDSPLAGEIDAAIQDIDEDPRLRDDALGVRLLEIPEVLLTAFWFHSDGVDDLYIPLGQFARSGDQHFAPLTAEELLALLPERQAAATVPPEGTAAAAAEA